MRLSAGYLVSILVILLEFIDATPHKLHHQTRQQNPKKCDLVCPGVAPIPLPSSLLQNCTGLSTNPGTTSTTKRPSTSSTTESSEEEGSTEESAGGGESRKAKRRNNKKRKSIRQHSYRRHTLILKPEAKSQLFKKHKNLNEKAKLDGCYVLCNGDSGAPSSGPPGGPPPETGGDSGEDSGDNYVEGEDTPIEIIYVPPTENDKRPSETYEINNYLVDPGFGFGYDPFFMEGKHKTAKKRNGLKRKTAKIKSHT